MFLKHFKPNMKTLRWKSLRWKSPKKSCGELVNICLMTMQTWVKTK